jgi:hypothetical protein
MLRWVHCRMMIFMQVNNDGAIIDISFSPWLDGRGSVPCQQARFLDFLDISASLLGPQTQAAFAAHGTALQDDGQSGPQIQRKRKIRGCHVLMETHGGMFHLFRCVVHWFQDCHAHIFRRLEAACGTLPSSYYCELLRRTGSKQTG